MGAGRDRVVRELGGPAALPPRARRRSGGDHARACRPPGGPLGRRRGGARWPLAGLRAGAPPPGRRPGRRGQRDRPVRPGGRLGLAGRARGGRERDRLRVEPALVAGRHGPVLDRVGPPEHALGRHSPDGPRRRRRGATGGRWGRRVRAAAPLASGRLAVVHLRPDGLVEPVPLDRGRRRRADGGHGRRDRGAAMGVRPVPLRLPARWPRGLRLQPGRLRPPGVAPRRRHGRRAVGAVHLHRLGRRRRGGRWPSSVRRPPPRRP